MAYLVKVSLHALERLEERWPETNGATRSDLHQLILTEVGDAIREQRMATKVPRWAWNGHDYRGKAKHSPSARFIWNEDETRVYLIDRRRTEVTVVTTIRPPAQTARRRDSVAYCD